MDSIQYFNALDALEKSMSVILAQFGEQLMNFKADLILAGITPGAIPLAPTVYGQQKMPWANKLLGGSKYTILQSGCLMCSYASATTDAGKPMNPEQMNDWLMANKGYVKDIDGQPCNFVFAAGDALGVLKFDTLKAYPVGVEAPIDKMDEYIKTGCIIVEVHPKAQSQHWCRYLGQGKIMDPWYGDIAPLVPRYYNSTNPADAIYHAAYYKKTGA